MKAVQLFPPKEQKSAAAEMLSAAQEIDQLDAEADHSHKVAALFCKAYERTVLLTPTLENVSCWVECTRMRTDEIEDSIKEPYELARTFQHIGDILKNEIL